jgi:AcrR family transcriptional regulator
MQPARTATATHSHRLPRGPYAISPEIVAANQRRRLLEAVPLVIAKHGFEGATIDRIVKLAAVRRNAFYEQFEDKLECVAAAYELAQERLLGAITYQCYSRAGLDDRIGGALTAMLELLDAEPAMARLLLLEAPLAGVELVARHHAWLDRYGRMLRFAVIGVEDFVMPSPGVEPAIVGGIASRIKESLLTGDRRPLFELAPELSAFALSFYGTVRPDLASERYESEQPQSPARADAEGSAVAA